MNIAEIVTEKILAMLESGVAPWRKPWSANNIQYRFTGQAYRGINQLLLALNPHPLPIWLTYRAAQQLGGNVKRGASHFCGIARYLIYANARMSRLPAGISRLLKL